MVRATLLAVVLFACGRGERQGGSRELPAAPRDAAAATSTIEHAHVTPERVATFAGNRVVGLALDGDGYAYAAELFGNQIFKVRLEPGALSTTLYRSPSKGTWGIVVRGDDILWSSSDTGRIYAAPRAGGGPIRVFADNLPGITWFRFDGDWLYWADTAGSAPGSVWKRPAAGGSSIAISTPAVRTEDILIEHDHLLVADDVARILSIDRDNSVHPWFDFGKNVQVEGLAADDHVVYATTVIPAQLVRIDKATRKATCLVEDPNAAYIGVTLDERYIYFVEYANPTLLRLPR